jgi:glycosyltransferase involved in cell wall biosynthesis
MSAMVTMVGGGRISSRDVQPAPHADRAPRRSRIVFLLPTFDIGGAERVVLRTAAGLNQARFEPVVLAFGRGGGRLAGELEAAGVPIDDLGASGRLAPMVVWRLRQWLRRRPCDVLMTFMFHANLAGRLVRAAGGVPVVVCSERAVWREPTWRLAINRVTAPLADVITTNSREGVRVWARRLGREESSIRLIYNGVNVERIPVPSRPEHPEVIIGNAARFHPLKGQAFLLEALARLAARADVPPWRCLLAGEGPDLAALQAWCAAHGLDRHISFVGHIDTPENFLARLDLFVNPSSTEGMPNAVLEAMASGLPVVATNVGGTPEAVEDGVTGRLVAYGDPEGLCEALASLVRDAPRRLAMGRAGRARVERLFSVGTMVAETERLLDEVLGITS